MDQKIYRPVTGRFPEAFSGQGLKLLAIAAMTLDHLAWAFVPGESLPGMALHTVGRITAPVMCFLLVEGFRHTGSPKRYALRLAVFALVSQPAYALFSSGTLVFGRFNMMWTLLICLMALWIRESSFPPSARLLGLAATALAAEAGDWGVWALVMTLLFAGGGTSAERGLFSRGAGTLRIRIHSGGGEKFGCAKPEANLPVAGMTVTAGMLAMVTAAQCRAAGMSPGQAARIALPQLGILLALPLLSRYRGERGRGGAWAKWFFYFYYPGHLLLIWLWKAASLSPSQIYTLV